MKTLTRYILQEFLKPFLVSLLLFSVIILIIQVFNEMRYIMDNKPGFLLTLKYFSLQVPKLLMQIIPFAVLMAVLLSLSFLSKNSELIAMRAGGVSIYLVAGPLVFCGLVVCCVSVFLNEVVVPKTVRMERHTRVVEIQHQSEPSASLFRQNISMLSLNNRFYHLGTFDGGSKTMTDILMLEFGKDVHLRSRVDAKKAVFESGQWVFYNGYLRAFDDSDNEISAQGFEKMPLTLPERPEDFLKEQKEPSELGFIELIALIRQLKANGADDHKELVELYNKIAFPFGCVILAVLGVPWGWTMKRFSGIVISFGVCILVAFFYLGGMQIGRNLGNSGVLSPFASMWTINILFGLIGPYLLFRKNR